VSDNKNVIPSKDGIHLSTSMPAGKWIPSFDGMTAEAKIPSANKKGPAVSGRAF
jgi:hypothetical protein